MCILTLKEDLHHVRTRNNKKTHVFSQQRARLLLVIVFPFRPLVSLGCVDCFHGEMLLLPPCPRYLHISNFLYLPTKDAVFQNVPIAVAVWCQPENVSRKLCWRCATAHKMTISNVEFKCTQAETPALAYENISCSFHGDVSKFTETPETRSGKKPEQILLHPGFRFSLDPLYFIFLILLFHQEWHIYIWSYGDILIDCRCDVVD